MRIRCSLQLEFNDRTSNPRQNGEFMLDEDEGDTYHYEQGAFAHRR